MPSVNPINNIEQVGVGSITTVTPATAESEKVTQNSSIASTEFYYQQSKYYAGQAAESAQAAAESAQQAIQDVDEIVANMQGIGTVHLDKDGKNITISTKNFVYEQDVASDEWVINHNLGKRPNVIIVDSSGKEFHPPVTHIDDNTCIATPLGAMTGTAYLN